MRLAHLLACAAVPVAPRPAPAGFVTAGSEATAPAVFASDPGWGMDPAPAGGSLRAGLLDLVANPGGRVAPPGPPPPDPVPDWTLPSVFGLGDPAPPPDPAGDGARPPRRASLSRSPAANRVAGLALLGLGATGLFGYWWSLRRAGRPGDEHGSRRRGPRAGPATVLDWVAGRAAAVAAARPAADRYGGGGCRAAGDQVVAPVTEAEAAPADPTGAGAAEGSTVFDPPAEDPAAGATADPAEAPAVEAEATPEPVAAADEVFSATAELAVAVPPEVFQTVVYLSPPTPDDGAGEGFLPPAGGPDPEVVGDGGPGPDDVLTIPDPPLPADRIAVLA
ncbi:MAG: hypothetical protein C0501_09310 [Isosphaera sp.]|nr:hypothetical protein [Isosphaera sp.]